MATGELLEGKAMATLNWVRDELDHEGVRYEELHHRPAYTAQAVAQCEHVSGHRVAKVVVVMADGRAVELVLPATRRVVLKWVGAVLGAQDVRLASEEDMARDFSDCEVGAIPPLRHWRGVEVLMDAFMQVDGDIVFQAGTHQDAVRMRCQDWMNMVNPRIARFTEPSDS
jgi:Ala-tRNA(Pro) deacylase